MSTLSSSSSSSSSPSPPVAFVPGVTRVGWIGAGVMGLSMCGHLMRVFPSNHFTIFTRTPSKAQPLLDLPGCSCSLASSPSEVGESSDIVFTMVALPSDVRSVYDQLLSHLKPGSIAVDMTTSEPSLAAELSSSGRRKGIHVLDAPVSGGDIGAKNATLSIMVGSDEKESLEAVRPLFQAMGNTITLCGKAGAGQHTKMTNQILIASGMIGVCEGLLYATKAGLDPMTAIAAVSSGAAGSWSISNLGPRIVSRNFDPGFFVEHFLKDMGIALDECKKMNLALPGLGLAYQLYAATKAQGHGKLGTQSLMLALEQLSGIKGKIGGKAGEAAAAIAATAEKKKISDEQT